MSVDVLYTTKAYATGGREGYAQTEDGSFKVTLDKPKEMGGKDKGNNPEQLFAAGYSACFLGAMKFVASQNDGWKIPEDAKVTATIGIGKRADGEGFGLTAALEISLPGVDKDIAEQIMNKAHIVCPYSHATRGNVDVKLSVA